MNKKLSVLTLAVPTLLVIILISLYMAGRTSAHSAIQSSVFQIVPVRQLYNMTTDFTAVVGQSVSHDGFVITCEGISGDVPVTVTSDNPNFAVNLTQVFCDSTIYPDVQFTPTAPGLTTAHIIVSSTFGTGNTELIGNGVIVESPPYWIADLGTDTYVHSIWQDTQRNLLYLTDQGNDHLIIFSPADRIIVKTIPVGLNPAGMAQSPDGNKLYVANSGESSISVIDLIGQTEAERILLPTLYPNPSEGFQYFYYPYEIVIISDTLALLGSVPPGYASGGPMYQFNLVTKELKAQGLWGARPAFAISRDHTAVGIVVEPGSSPTLLARYDVISDTFVTNRDLMNYERNASINSDGSQMITTFYYCNILAPNLHRFDQNLTTLPAIKTLGCPTVAAIYDPLNGNNIYTLDDSFTSIGEVQLDEGRQTRAWLFNLPANYGFWFGGNPRGRSMAIANDGAWVYARLNQPYSGSTFGPSKLLAVYIGPMYKTYLPALAR
jgi:YVTN family beta-propeller protein